MLKALKHFSLLLITTLLTGCVSTAFTGAQLFYDRHNINHKLQNHHVTLQIQNAINAGETFKTSNISVETFNYVVLLTGQTPTAALREQAGKIATKIPKVKHVFNKIRVSKPLSRFARTKDTWITTKIKIKLIANSKVDPSKIKVVTEDKVVYLLGSIKREQADIAVKLAAKTRGVKKVVKMFRYVVLVGKQQSQKKQEIILSQQLNTIQNTAVVIHNSTIIPAKAEIQKS